MKSLKLIMNDMTKTPKEIRPSQRVETIKEYYFSRKLKEIARLRATGLDIISLGIGGPDLPPSKNVIDRACDVLHRPDSHSYQMTIGIPELRASYASWYARYYGVEGLNPDSEILPLIGSKEGCVNISLAFLNPGDGVLVPNPGYPTYTSASRLAQAEIYTYDLDEEHGWYPDFDALERMPLEKIRLMWVNYPHMPTGTPATMELFGKLVDFGRRHGIVIVNDNPYSFILNDTPLSILKVPGAKDIAIEMNSLSKCLNMAGWRVGVLVSNPRFVEWVLKVKSNIDSGQPRAIMAGAVEALSNPPEWYSELNAVYSSRRDMALEIMDALGCDCRPGQQGLFLWGRIPEDAPGSEAFAQEVLDEARVFITPGFIFGSAGERYIRISLCAPEKELRRALERIREMKSKK